MIPGDLLIVLGLNGQVAALARENGRLLWTADLPGILGDSFVTVTSDDTRIYAYTHSQVHCLNTESGRLLWSNDLKGFGRGIATVCVPGGPAAGTVPAAQVRLEAQRQKRSRKHPPSQPAS